MTGKLKKKVFKIDLAIYESSVYVCFKDLELLRELLQKEEHPPNDCQWETIYEALNIGAEGLALNVKNGSIIYIPTDKKSFPYLANILSHEIFHATDQVLENVGMSLTSGSEEAYAYLTGYITEKLYEQL
jgi:hypothetical protein